MKLDDFVKLLREKQSADKAKEEKIKAKYKVKAKGKSPSIEDRLSLVEELLGIKESEDA